MQEKELKYEIIAFDLRKKILKRIYKRNEQLPLEKEICESYGVSRITVKKAVDMLVQEGLVVKRRGAGTFVKDLENFEYIEESVNKLKGFSEIFNVDNISFDILNFTIENPNRDISEKLKISEQDFIYRIIRLGKIDKEPICIEEKYIPINVIIGLRLENVSDSVYNYIEKHLHFKIQSAHKTISSRIGNDDELRLLNIESNNPLLIIEQVGYLDTGQIFEFSKQHYRSDRFKYHTIDFR